MAERRMFAKTIIDSDAFLEMPATSQLLYFHLAMRADDEGFINKPKTIMKIVGAKEDDLNILAARKFIIPFNSGVVVIKHWKIHNYIRGDRIHETKYKNERDLLENDENNAYTLCQSNVSQVSDNCHTEVRLGKVRLGKVRLGESMGTFNNVLLTPEEKVKLINEYGQDLTNQAIDHLSAYREEKGYKSKNDYLTIRRWVISAVTERKNKSTNPFKDALMEEIKNEQERDCGDHDDIKSSFSLLLQGSGTGE